ncbi:MAG: hypothetical protein AAFW60_07615 [Pseudomonadota bacterium]
MSAYIRRRLFDDPAPRRKVRMPGGDEQRMAQVLAVLGQSGISESLLELAYSAKIGALVLTKDNEEALHSACAAVQAMRADLIAALGLHEAQI